MLNSFSELTGYFEIQVLALLNSFKMRMQTRTVFMVGVLFSCAVIFLALEIWSILSSSDDDVSDFPLNGDFTEIRLKVKAPLPGKRDLNCRMHSCFDIFRCAENEKKLISVYVYPNNRFLDEDGQVVNKEMSQEFYELISAVVKSQYYTSDLSRACIIVPLIDTLNQNGQNLNGIARILGNLPR